MGERYEPPFTMTGEITNLIVEIGELVGAITTLKIYQTDLHPVYTFYGELPDE